MSNNSIRDGFGLLAKPNVRKTFIAYLISFTGTAMAPIAMAFGVLELTGSTKDASIVIAAPTLATIAVLLFGGVIADRTSRQKVIYRSELLAMAAQFVMAYLFLSGHATITLLTVFMLINGIAVALRAPASAGLIVQLVDKEDLQSTNALLGAARNGAVVAGAALGGVLVAFVGAGWTLFIDAVSFAVSALLIFTLKPKVQRKLETASLFNDLREGWNEFSSHTWLWVVVLQFSLVVAAAESVFGLIGPAITRDYMGGATHWGFIASGFGLGTLAGGIVSMKIRPKYPIRNVCICALFFTGIEITLAMLAPLYIIVTAAFISGLAVQLCVTFWNTTLQLKIPTHLLSRVTAYDHLGSIALAPLGIVAAGILYEVVGYKITLLIAIATVITPTLLALTVREVRMMTNDS